MDNFMNLAKQGYEAYSKSQSNTDVHKTGGQEYNSPNNNHGNSRPQFDHDDVVRRAEEHGSGDSSHYKDAMRYVNDNENEHNEEVNEREVHEAHDKAYNQDGAKDLSAKGMGGAAAMQVLKKFTGGGGGGSSGGGGSTSDLMSLAMAEASKLFDKSGGAASGNKQDAVNGAAMTVMKLLVQSKASSIMGGNKSGGMGDLMGLAAKFM